MCASVIMWADEVSEQFWNGLCVLRSLDIMNLRAKEVSTLELTYKSPMSVLRSYSQLETSWCHLVGSIAFKLLPMAL